MDLIEDRGCMDDCGTGVCTDIEKMLECQR